MDLSKSSDQAGLFTTIAIHAILLLLIILFGRACNVEAEDALDGGVSVVLGDPNAGGYDNLPPVSEETESEATSEEDASQITSDNSDAPAVQETASSPRTNQPTNPQPKPQTPKPEEERKPDPRSTYGGTSSGGGTGGAGEPGVKGDPSGGPSGQEQGSGTGPNGEGFSGKGFMGKIDGFKLIGYHLPINEQQQFGTVVVKVCVDKQGKVVSVQGGQRGTTNPSSYLRKISEDAARKFTFDRIGTATDLNCGYITFTYKAS